eukprot:3967232-Alexandrium_andersonii.AAC.1
MGSGPWVLVGSSESGCRPVIHAILSDSRHVPQYDLGDGLVGVGLEQYVYVGLPADVEIYV